MHNNRLLKKAQYILNNNFQKGGYTIPCENLYPFQWKWDSGFIAIGYAHFDMLKAEKEIATLLKAQWSNGFIPHIIFHKESDTYFPGPNFYQSKLNPAASKSIRTSGITQPPVIGFVLEKMYEISLNKSNTLSFIKTQIDSVYNNHIYFYDNRDLYDEGLVYIYHNWESGTDNSPLWDDIWKTMDPPNYKFERRDTNHVDPSQRPTKREYDHYINIIEIAKKNNYNDSKIAMESPFLVQDPLFNSILIRSNEALIKLYKIIGGNQDKINYLKTKNEKSKNGMNKKLYNKDLNAYVHYDLRNDKPISFISSSSFIPFFCGAPSMTRAKMLLKTLITKFADSKFYLCASFDPKNRLFNPKKYWRGPVWINLNWMLYNGLKRYDFNDVARRIKKDSITLIDKKGFYEYFDPRKDKSNELSSGYGGSNFSWTAALFIDFLNSK